jgi:hypothetical protein
MLPDLSNTMYMSTGAKQLPPLVPLVPPLLPLVPLVPPLVPKPLVPPLVPPLLPPLVPPELKVESSADVPHATATRRLQVTAAKATRRAEDPMNEVYPTALDSARKLHAFAGTPRHMRSPRRGGA